MRIQTMAIPMATAMVLLTAASPWAATLNGTVKLGGVVLDETGDRSTTQESYNLEEGFSVTRVQLTGTLDPRTTFLLDLRDINLRSRAGDLALRVPGRFKLTAGYDQNRYVFDPDARVTSERKDWKLGAQYTVNPWLTVTGDASHQSKTGDRLAYPLGTMSALGDRFDDRLVMGGLTADIRNGRRGGGVSFRMSDYSDDLNGDADRQGRVVAARLYAPMPFYDKWNNLLRGSYGVRELSNGNVEYKLSTFQYTAVVQPREAYQVKYAFDASRVDDDALDLQTDRFQNDLDATWFHRYGQVSAGYGYEMNDDDRTLTTYNSWRAGTVLRPDPRVSARVDYAGRVKKDQEELTLLKDVEASKFRGRLDLKPVKGLTVGGDYARREREFTDIHVKTTGTAAGAMLRYDLEGWGAVSSDYSHSNDQYDDLLAGFETESDVVTARVEVGRIKNLQLASGVAYLKIDKDLDIEKSLVFVEGGYRLFDRYHVDVKYNCFNYDDYVLIDRYYTANVVQFSLGYDLNLK